MESSPVALLRLSMEVMCPSFTVIRGCSTISFPRKSCRAVIVLVISVLPLTKDIATGDWLIAKVR